MVTSVESWVPKYLGQNIGIVWHRTKRYFRVMWRREGKRNQRYYPFTPQGLAEARRFAESLPPTERDLPKRVCIVPHCDRVTVTRDMCNMHYCRWVRKRNRLGYLPCQHIDCERQQRTYGYCSTHASRYYRNGSPYSEEEADEYRRSHH